MDAFLYESLLIRSYRVLDKDDVQVSSALSVSRYAAAILLQKYGWNGSVLLYAWFDDEDGVPELVGLSNKSAVRFRKSGESLVCGICFETYEFDERLENTVGFCGHSFCTACLETYVSKAIDDGPACLVFRCPDPDCRTVIGEDRVNILVSDEGKMKYKEFLIRSYVEDNKYIKWFPTPNCEYAIHYLGGESYDVTCRCSSSFCWNCLEESHSPVACETAAKWMLENSPESDTVTWILANSQPCPECRVPIEKNRGSKHMTCLCGYEFCWICLGRYKGHNNVVCVLDRVKQDKNIEERVRKEAEGCNMRYVRYFERWDANHKAREEALADLWEMRNGKLGEYRIFRFLTEAWKQIVECRRLLKWTYVYAYYMPEEAFTKIKLFEYFSEGVSDGLSEVGGISVEHKRKNRRIPLRSEWGQLRHASIVRTRNNGIIKPDMCSGEPI